MLIWIALRTNTFPNYYFCDGKYELTTSVGLRNPSKTVYSVTNNEADRSSV